MKTQLARLANIKKMLEQFIMKNIMERSHGEKLRCLPGWPGWPGCNFLLKIN